jgi:hypothetical protein
MKVARHMAMILSRIPTIQCIGITGGLSVGNADPEDDIDFFIITTAGTVWITRFLATLYMEIVGQRRRPESEEVANMICLNMYMNERAMGVKKQDIYTGHEILQMVPVINKNHCYEQFLSANVWVSYIFPQKWRKTWEKRKSIVHNRTQGSLSQYISWLLKFGEQPVMVAQLWYMKKRRTQEEVGNEYIQFHPHDAHVWVKQKLKKRLQSYHILPLDKHLVSF